MLKYFRPDYQFHNIFEITPYFLMEKKIKGILVDLDKTLAPYGMKTATDEVKDWILRIKGADIGICIVSNNRKKRVTEFCENLDIPFYWSSAKPRRGTLQKAIDELCLEKQHAALIGDKIFTDIFGAKRIGITAIRIDNVAPVNKPDLTKTIESKDLKNESKVWTCR